MSSTRVQVLKSVNMARRTKFIPNRSCLGLFASDSKARTDNVERTADAERGNLILLMQKKFQVWQDLKPAEHVFVTPFLYATSHQIRGKENNNEQILPVTCL